MASSSSSSPEITSVVSPETQRRFSYKDATHEEVLEDLSSRFILNLPDEELASLERICFQVEQAHWFYEDFIREENPKFPTLPLKKFSAMLFHACPLLHQWSDDHERAFTTFMQYKTRVPVCGAIMLNSTWEKCVLVKGWKSSSGWGFPKGKINEVEPPPDCAIREVLEETGYNLAGQLNPEHVVEISIKQQKISLFIVPGVPEDFPFKTKTRKEISKIEWFKLTDLPTWKRNKAAPGKFYLISPFIVELKTFINQHKPRNAGRRSTNHKANSATASANSRAKRVVVNPADVLVNHESVSHTSPLDNRDLQTPSSQSKDSDPRVEDNKSSSLSDSMDPHFARLLSSLTMSAAASPAAGSEASGGPIAVLGNPLPKDFTGPNSVPEPLISSQVGVKSDWSSSASSHVPLQSDELPPPLPSPASDSEKPVLNVDSRESETYQLLSPHVVVNARDGESSVHPPRPQIAASPIQSTVQSTARVNTSRRVSTADVSPYLSRAVEVPTSAKRLQQLALLESVADESARMTPLLASRAVVPHMRYPIPSPSNPPQPMSMYNLNSALPSNQLTAHPEANGPFKPLYPSSGHVNNNHDPFQVRARTSQAFRRNPIQPYSGSMSMNQSQLLNIMNGAGPSPALRSSGYYPSYPYPPFGTANSATIVQPLPQAAAPAVYQNHGPTIPKVSSISLNPAMPNVLGNGLGASTNPLLSILNARTTGLGPSHT
ncbi:uncharacterized protein LACBIDRAFT_300645 [Laccaria bicolor S238N-H82]|uniref:Predicted protein n=1 Tax=Laccaria bicolor (strain S238N-H82 / ATCC MYA-4686) TaxID=486041 RepID=B0CPT0_LACBS|nr:uncharacterized protein LACBIDRAFT_300645 [Laccaria bicolor S238N-H82]EDR14983.1 predicted protein [Laccaria bicolor S238N-H82]|eukprot:XP_001873191.1 predicted protein [Laccaria bicolor S238N-H82]